MPRLRVLAGPSSSSLTPITSLVNTTGKHNIKSDAFEGQISVNIKGLIGEDGAVREGEYFAREDRQGITWSIQVQGRFLTPHTADDILFGNTFDKPLRLPWGSGAALKFMKYIDPVLEHDLASTTKPWALSPLIATMPHFVHRHLDVDSATDHGNSVVLPTFPPEQSISDDVSQLPRAARLSRASPSPSISSSASSSSTSSSNSSSLSLSSTSSKLSTTSKTKSIISSLSSKSKKDKKGISSSSSSSSSLSLPLSDDTLTQIKTSSERRTYFSDATNRQSIVFGPNDLITTDFCYGFLQFSPSLALALPGGLSFDLMRYWDGQPVRFVCCEGKKKSPAPEGLDGVVEDVGEEVPWGRVFWTVVIELVD